jgi:hypothetical protein
MVICDVSHVAFDVKTVGCGQLDRPGTLQVTIPIVYHHGVLSPVEDIHVVLGVYGTSYYVTETPPIR